MAKKMRWKKVLLVILGILILGFILLLFLIPSTMINEMAHKHMDVEICSPSSYGLDASSISLETTDQLHLAAWHVEAENTKGTIILLSGIQSPSVTEFFSYAKMFADYGYDSLLIEMRSHGDSEGNIVCLGMKEWRDVKAGVDFILEDDKLKDLPIIVFGTSMGGATALIATGEIPEIDGVISCSAYSSWTDVFTDQMKRFGVPDFFTALDKPFINAYLGFTYGFNNLKFTPLNAMKKLNNRPTLLMHSTQDSQVPYSSFERLMRVAPNNVETFIREGDAHFICLPEYATDPTMDKAFSNMIFTFLETYF